jgi:predicted RNase H-like HicB family nuclease
MLLPSHCFPGVRCTMKYAIVIEPTSTGFSAYVPDVPGCVAAGETEAEVKTLIREALQFHLTELRRDGEPIPEPTSRIDYVQIVETDVVA